MRSSQFLISFATAALVVTSACAERDKPPPRDLDLSERLVQGQVRAGRISKGSDLVGGPIAKGKIGDYKLYNSRVAFVIGDAGSADGYSPWGGKVVDADRVRAAGEAGGSRFGEWILGFDQRVCGAEKATVVSDGSDGRAAVVRVEGPDASIPLLEVALEGIFTSRPLGTWITIDYVLEPDADVLRVKMTVENRSGADLHLQMRQMGILMGDGAQPWQPVSGFDSGVGSSPYYAALGPDVSYGIFGTGPLSFVFDYNSLLLTSQGSLDLRNKEIRTFEYMLAVGGGGTTALERAHAAATGASRQVAPVTGRLTDASGAPISGARVLATELVAEGGERETAVGITGPGGGYEIDLPVGRYRLLATSSAYPPSEPSELVVSGVAAVVGPTLRVGDTGRFEYSVTDGSGSALPAKITIVPLGDTPGNPPERLGTRRFAAGAVKILYAHTGSGVQQLAAGRYRVTVSRGFEYDLEQIDVELGAGATVARQFRLARVVDTTGYLSGDFHLHAQASPDSDDMNDEKVAGFAAEGLEIPVSTDHEYVTDYTPTVKKLGLERWVRSVVGSEVTTFSYGHFNAFPLTSDPQKRNRGFIPWYFKDGPELFADIRAAAPSAILQINHPRALAVGGYFSVVEYDPQTGGAHKPQHWSADFDAIEVMNGKRFAEPQGETLVDWYSFLNRGKRVTATGNSDSHSSFAGATIGFPRNYVQVPSEDLSRFDQNAFITAVREGRVVVSGGPFLRASVGGKGPGQMHKAIGEDVPLDVEVQAPLWMNVNELIVVANGAEVLRRAIGPSDADATNPVVRLKTTLSINLTRDSWLVVFVRGSGSLAPVVTGARPFAFTNAIYVDRDGNGRFDPPL